jgi:hypothetical protein
MQISAGVGAAKQHIPKQRDSIAVLALSLLGLLATFLTWQRWGNVTVDCGREMMIPAAIVAGKRLYFDLWYPYGPAIPYWHALLFRLFGVHLNVLYGAGLTMAGVLIGSTYGLARKFLPVVPSFAGALVVMIGGFGPTIFNYVLPYSYPALYAAALAVATVWLLVEAVMSGSRWPVAAAGALTGIVLATKTEFGLTLACLMACGLALRVWQQRSVRSLLIDVACIAPLPLLAAAWYAWLLSQSSYGFLFEQNIPLGANSYFVKEFGKRWLFAVGFPKSIGQLLTQVGMANAAVAIWVMLIVGLRARNRRWVWWMSILILSGAAIAIGWRGWFGMVQPELIFRILRTLTYGVGLVWAALPLAAVAAWRVWRDPLDSGSAAQLVLALAAMGLGLRVSVNILLNGYAIFFVPVPYVAWLTAIYFFSGNGKTAVPESSWRGLAVVLCCSTLAFALPAYRWSEQRTGIVSRPVGTLRLEPALAAGYTQLLNFLDGLNRRSERWITLPEDSGLYFLTGTTPPNRWYVITPGVLPPGQLTAEYLSAIDRAGVRFILLSNRKAPEYGVTGFGEPKWNPEVMAWIRENFVTFQEFGNWDDPWAARVLVRRSAVE